MNDFKTATEAAGIRYTHTFENRPKKEDYYRHNHSDYELYICFSGDMDFVVEDRMYELPPDSVLLIRPFTYHYASLHNFQKPYHRMSINFEKNTAFPETFSFLESEKEFFVWKQGDLLRMAEEAEAKMAEYGRNDSILYLKMFINEMLLGLKYAGKTFQKTHSLNPSVSQILRYVNDHLNEPLSLKKISSNLFLTPTYISQVFSKHMKIGVMDYVKQKKIHLAQDMIANGISPCATARQLGFGEYSTFYRLFQKYLKEKPSAPLATRGHEKEAPALPKH